MQKQYLNLNAAPDWTMFGSETLELKKLANERIDRENSTVNLTRIASENVSMYETNTWELAGRWSYDVTRN